MRPILRPLLRCLLLAGLLLRLPPAQAQLAPASSVAPQGYDFLMVTVQESPYKREPHMRFAPAFQGQTVLPLPLSNVYASSPEELAKAGECLTITAQQLSVVTVAGWELFQMNVINSLAGRITTRYLFRKAKS